MDLVQELRGIVAALDAKGIPYALCGGLALAVYGAVRATLDVDILILPEDLSAALNAGAALGYDLPAAPMVFAGGEVEIRRISKAVPDTDALVSLDLLLASEALRPIFASRQQVSWEDGTIWVVSRFGLASLKNLRGSTQDQADLARLREVDDAG